MAEPQKFLCCSDIFRAAKVFAIVDFVIKIVTVSSIFLPLISLLLPFLAYLAVEFYGIKNKEKCLILFGFVIIILKAICVAIGLVIGISYVLFTGSEGGTAESYLTGIPTTQQSEM